MASGLRSRFRIAQLRRKRIRGLKDSQDSRYVSSSDRDDGRGFVVRLVPFRSAIVVQAYLPLRPAVNLRAPLTSPAC